MIVTMKHLCLPFRRDSKIYKTNNNLSPKNTKGNQNLKNLHLMLSQRRLQPSKEAKEMAGLKRKNPLKVTAMKVATVAVQTVTLVHRLKPSRASRLLQNTRQPNSQSQQ